MTDIAVGSERRHSQGVYRSANHPVGKWLNTDHWSEREGSARTVKYKLSSHPLCASSLRRETTATGKAACACKGRWPDHNPQTIPPVSRFPHRFISVFLLLFLICPFLHSGFKSSFQVKDSRAFFFILVNPSSVQWPSHPLKIFYPTRFLHHPTDSPPSSAHPRGTS